MQYMYSEAHTASTTSFTAFSSYGPGSTLDHVDPASSYSPLSPSWKNFASSAVSFVLDCSAIKEN